MDVVSRVGDVVTDAPLRVLLREDYEACHRSWGRPGLHGLIVYRIGRWARTQPAPIRIPLTVLHRVINNFVIRNLYGMEISVDAVIGRRVTIGHHQAVQIPSFCIIGDDSVLRQNVNLGFISDVVDRTAVPHIGRGVIISPGAQILGPIAVGDGARIGPNCVVTMNVPAGATLISPPSRVIKAAPAAPTPGAATPEEPVIQAPTSASDTFPLGIVRPKTAHAMDGHRPGPVREGNIT